LQEELIGAGVALPDATAPLVSNERPLWPLAVIDRGRRDKEKLYREHYKEVAELQVEDFRVNRQYTQNPIELLR
jgi:hypothetical protein